MSAPTTRNPHVQYELSVSFTSYMIDADDVGALRDEDGKDPDSLKPAVGKSLGSPEARVFEKTAPEHLKGHSVRGGAITIGTQAFKFVLQTGSVAVLARLLSPYDFGLQGMVVVITGALNLFRDAGLGAATIQRETITHDQLSTLFWINVAIGTVLAVTMALLAPVLVIFNHEPRLFWIAIISAFSFLFGGAAAQHGALLQRHMRFATMAKVDLVSQTLSVALGIGMALYGFGYWALVAMAVGSSIFSSVGLWLSVPWKPGLPRRNSGVRSMLHFGGTVTLNNLVVYAGYNTEKIFLGRQWGAEVLGLYGRAYQLVNLPLQQLYGSIYTVAFPALSRIQGDAEKVARSFLKGYAVLLSLAIPINVISAIYAEEIIRLLLGGKWMAAAPILRLLTPSILVFALINPFGWLLIATGRTVRSLNMALVIAPVVILGVILGIPYGPNGVAMGYSIAMSALFVPLVAWAIHGTGITAGDYWHAVRKPLFAGLVAGLCSLPLKFLLSGELAVLKLIAASLITGGVYTWMLLWVMEQKELYLDLARQILKRPKSI